MSDAIVTTLITSLVTLVGVFYSAKSTRDKMTAELDKKTALQSAEIDYIKSEMSEMKQDIKEHNNYARMYQESVAVNSERYNMLSHRVDEMERCRLQ